MVFDKTLLVITYDEHGGLYDHVTPPTASPPGGRSWRSVTRRLGGWLRARADRRAGRKPTKRFDFGHLGVRVPAVLVSPWIQPGTIVAETFDHASIPHTLRELFAPGSKALTKRDGDAETFHQIVTESPLVRPRPSPGQPNPDNLPPVPDLSALAHDDGLEAPVQAAHGTPPGAPEPTGKIDRQLVALAAHVERRLRRSPTTVVARRRAARLGHAGALAARTGEVFPTDNTVSLFRASAKTARRRPVRRPPG